MIAIVYPQFYGVGGIARYIESFLSSIPEGSPTVFLVTGSQEFPERSYSGVEIIHIPVPSNRLGLLLWSLKARACVERLHRQGRINGINLHIPPLIPGLFLSAQVPMTLTAHTTYFGMSGRFDGNRNFASPWNAAALWIKMQMEKFIFAKARSIISLTEQGRRELQHYGSYDVTVIPNGVDLSQFEPDFTVQRDFDVIFCGRIEKRKGSRPLVEVCRRLVQAKPDIRIAIVGYGDDDEYVRAGLKEYSSNIELTGKVPFTSMMGYYSRSKIYASTSYYEGLPGTCLEAMSMGLPAVVWDFLFYKDLVIEGETGALAAPNDHDAMVGKMAALLESPDAARTMGLAGRDLIRRRYDWRLLSREVLAASSAPVATDAATSRGQA